MKKGILIVIAVIIIILGITFVSKDSPSTITTEDTPPSVTMESLLSMSYLGGDVLLQNGTFYPKGEENKNDYFFELNELQTVFGNLDEDSDLEAATILHSRGGGTGAFRHLAIVKLVDGEPTNITWTLVGDRVSINSLTIDGGQVHINMIGQGEGEPLCCGTTEMDLIYRLQGNEIVKQ